MMNGHGIGWGVVAMAAALTGLGGCEAYDAPPEVTLEQPESGNFVSGEPVRLRFSEPIIPGSLSIRVWQDERDIEGELPSGATPRLASCTLQRSPCQDATVAVDDDGLGATITLDPETLGRPDVPLLLEVEPGLSDSEGASTGASRWFDFLFKPGLDDGPREPIDFDSGIYLIVAQIQQPLPAVLTLVTDLRVLEDGSLALAGGKANKVDGAPKNTLDPTEVFIDDSEQGFGIFASGLMRLKEDGVKFMETEPVEVNIAIGPIGINLHNVRLTGDVVPDEERGGEKIDGRLTFTGLTINSGGNDIDYEAGGTTFAAVKVVPEEVPEGTPDLCGELCGAVTAQCEPPADFPGAGFCDQ